MEGQGSAIRYDEEEEEEEAANGKTLWNTHPMMQQMNSCALRGTFLQEVRKCMTRACKQGC